VDELCLAERLHTTAHLLQHRELMLPRDLSFVRLEEPVDKRFGSQLGWVSGLGHS
jgi:hypothetical protein